MDFSDVSDRDAFDDFEERLADMGVVPEELVKDSDSDLEIFS